MHKSRTLPARLNEIIEAEKNLAVSTRSRRNFAAKVAENPKRDMGDSFSLESSSAEDSPGQSRSNSPVLHDGAMQVIYDDDGTSLLPQITVLPSKTHVVAPVYSDAEVVGLTDAEFREWCQIRLSHAKFEDQTLRAELANKGYTEDFAKSQIGVHDFLTEASAVSADITRLIQIRAAAVKRD